MVFQVIEAHEENSYPPKKAARLSAPPVKAVSNLKGLKGKNPRVWGDSWDSFESTLYGSVIVYVYLYIL